MSDLFDDISRIIARPMPRRQAFKLVGGAVGGTVLASLGLGGASRILAANCGRATCTGSQSCCFNTLCCSSSAVCCKSSSGNPKCCNPGTICCPQTGKPGKFQCCVAGSGSSNTCVGATKCT